MIAVWIFFLFFFVVRRARRRRTLVSSSKSDADSDCPRSNRTGSWNDTARTTNEHNSCETCALCEAAHSATQRAAAAAMLQRQREGEVSVSDDKCR